MLVRQLHHYSMKCETPEEAARARDFYCGVLGMPVAREWAQGFMLDCGGSYVEVFTNGAGTKTTGALRHIALAVDDADACAEAVRSAGYEVFLGPKNITVPVPARIAFCFGPLGEQVEFFQPVAGAEAAQQPYTLRDYQAYLLEHYREHGVDTSLFMKLVEEVGEAAEVLNRRDGRKAADGDDLKTQLAHELADVIHYAAAIAALNGIDLNDAILEKDRTAAVKYHHARSLEEYLNSKL